LASIWVSPLMINFSDVDKNGAGKIVRCAPGILLVALALLVTPALAGSVSVLTDTSDQSALEINSNSEDRTYSVLKIRDKAVVSFEKFSHKTDHWHTWGEVSTRLGKGETATTISVEVNYQHVGSDSVDDDEAVVGGDIYQFAITIPTNTDAAQFSNSGAGFLQSLDNIAVLKHAENYSDSFEIDMNFALSTATNTDGKRSVGMSGWRFNLAANHGKKDQ
jgi:hypothetical protein